MQYTVLAIFLSVLGLYFLQTQPVFTSPERPPVYIPPPESIEHISFGYQSTVANILWLRYMQAIDGCGKKKEKKQVRKIVKNKAIIAIDKDLAIKESIFDNKERTFCRKGWAFRLLEAITVLDPKFRKPYLVGGTSLSVFLDDIEGAQIIFDRGVRQFPNYWPLLFQSAYHALYELKDFAKAADLLSRAASNGAPFWVGQLAARLYSQAGQVELGIQFLEAQKKAITDIEKTQLIQERLNRLYIIYNRLNDKKGHSSSK